jgi:5'-methylthioadenosine phosphorylase
MMLQAVLGVFGGSGVHDLPGLEDVREEHISSPWGEASGPLKTGRIGKTKIVFLSRHGTGHCISPSHINYRANIDVMKRVGVTSLVALSACGSLQEHLSPGMFILVDQFVDRTYKRENSFFGPGCVAHVSMAQPVAPLLWERLVQAASLENLPHHRGGTYLCIEGPQFSSRAESSLYRQWGCDVIGMTNMPEARLAREAQIPYASVAMVTDYDSWDETRAPVEVAHVIAVLKENAAKAARLVARLARDFPNYHEPCPIGSDRALETALATDPAHRDPELMKKLSAVLRPVAE